MKYFIYITIAVIMVLGVNVSAQINSSADNINTAMSGEILYYINEHRNRLGLVLLQSFEAADTEAASHSRNMVEKITPFGHNGFEERVERLRKKRTTHISAAAENVALGKLTAKEVVSGWLQRPRHKRNIEGDYSHTGIGVAKAKDGVIYFTEIFLK